MSCVLITGATGVIGSELVPLFLDSDDCRLRLIVRADSASHLQERTGELLAYWGRRPQDPAVAGRVEVLAGDVGRPRLGLDDATYRRLTGEVTHVVHSAGNVKLSQSLEEARANAVGSAQRVVEFARSCQDRGLLQKLDVVSTMGVAGRMPGLVPERRLSEPREFHNTYEQAKAEAEELLFQELQTGLPVTIHRPSMVVGNSQTGRIRRFQVFYYLCEFLSGSTTRGIIVDTGEARLDIIPVDYVARAIHIASGQADSVGRVFHLCSGPKNAVRLADLAERLYELAVIRGEKALRLRRVPLRRFRRLLPWVGRMTRGKMRRMIQNLPFFLAYLDEQQMFDIVQTRAFLSARSVALAPPARYLEKLLDFYHAARSHPADSSARDRLLLTGSPVAVAPSRLYANGGANPASESSE
jgi:thioester reductase-like protein